MHDRVQIVIAVGPPALDFKKQIDFAGDMASPSNPFPASCLGFGSIPFPARIAIGFASNCRSVCPRSNTCGVDTFRDGWDRANNLRDGIGFPVGVKSVQRLENHVMPIV
jgi:hypothetical protein